jgi:hypothetical protein
MTGIAGQAIGIADEQLQPIAHDLAIDANSRGTMEPFIGFFDTGSVIDPLPADFTAPEDNVTAASDGTSRYAPVYSTDTLTWDDVTASLPVNDTPPEITGIPSSSNTLTCDPGTWTDADSISFRWLRNNVPMFEQTGSTLLVISPYIGDVMSCAVTAHNEVGPTTELAPGVTIIP